MSLIQEAVQQIKNREIIFSTGGSFDPKEISKPLIDANAGENLGSTQSPAESRQPGALRGEQIASAKAENWWNRNG